MPKKVHELVRLARKESGISQEAAAPKLYLTVKQLKRMESGEAAVDPGTVGRMVTLYCKPMLALQYVNACAEEAGMGPIMQVDDSLQGAVMQLISRVYDFADAHRDRRLLSIAADGVIDDEERPDFDQIVQELQSIVQAATVLRTM